LIALLRLRNGEAFRSELEGAALIRELHVFGPTAKLSETPASSWQHRGYGRLLLDEAERIAFSEWDKSKIVVISGVGVKPYFQKFGYEYEGPYMSKTF
jgi:elongator complex protein 3